MTETIFTDRVRSTRREVIVSLCLSVHTCGGVPRPGSSQPGGDTRWGGTPCWGGTPPQVPPMSDLAGGTPPRVLPHQTWPGGTPQPKGYPTLGTPPIGPGRGVPLLGEEGTPLQETDGVLDTLRSVCLLRSRRRTFFLLFLLLNLQKSTGPLWGEL